MILVILLIFEYFYKSGTKWKNNDFFSRNNIFHLNIIVKLFYNNNVYSMHQKKNNNVYSLNPINYRNILKKNKGI
jgi:hypothetical protein